MGVNSLPKTVTRQRRGCDLNSGPSAPESSTLTTRLQSHRWRHLKDCSYRLSEVYFDIYVLSSLLKKRRDKFLSRYNCAANHFCEFSINIWQLSLVLPYWHCLHSMRGRVYETTWCRPSVRLSVRPSRGPLEHTRCCMFAAVGPARRRYRSIAAAAADECGQCHDVSVRR